MSQDPIKTVIDSILEAKIHWIFLVAGMVYSAVVTIILPIQKLQIQTNQIQTTLTQIQSSSQQASADVSAITNRVSVLESEIHPLLNK